MKCNKCQFGTLCDILELFADYGTQWRDGLEGCTLTRAKLEHIQDEHERGLYEMGVDTGFEETIKARGLDMRQAIRAAGHTIGLDWNSPYMRHGKLFYKPKRNYYGGQNDYLDIMTNDAFKFAYSNRPECYHLTREGLDWLGRRLHIAIKDYD